MLRSASTASTSNPVAKQTVSIQCVPMSATARSSPPSAASTRQLKSVSCSSQSCKYDPVTCNTRPSDPAFTRSRSSSTHG